MYDNICFMSSLIKKICFLVVVITAIYFLLIFKDVSPKAYKLVVDYHRVTPLSPLYYAKIFREFMQSKFIFGTEEKVYRYFSLADKRITEAQYLLSAGAVILAGKQAGLAADYQKKGSEYLINLKDKVDINYLLQMENENNKRL